MVVLAVEVRLYATFREYYPPEAEDGVYMHELKKEGETLKELVSKLNIPLNEIHLLIINGKQGDFDYQLQDGDRIGLFPPVGGG